MVLVANQHYRALQSQWNVWHTVLALDRTLEFRALPGPLKLVSVSFLGQLTTATLELSAAIRSGDFRIWLDSSCVMHMDEVVPEAQQFGSTYFAQCDVHGP